MRFLRPVQTLLCSAVCLCLAVCACLACSGCVGGKKDEVAAHIFVGDTAIPGTVQIATNDPITVGPVQIKTHDPVEVISSGKDEKAHWEKRDCGQFVLMPPHIYRAVGEDLKRLQRYRDQYGEIDLSTGKPGEVDAHAPRNPLEHFLLYRVPEDGARAEIVDL